MSFADLDAALAGRATLFFEGHGDAPLGGEHVLAFVGPDGEMETLAIRTIAETVRPHAVEGELLTVVLMGCQTLALAKALREAGVANVICWETILHDRAAAEFSGAFALRTAAGRTPQQAFDEAQAAVESITEPGYLDSGLPALVQKYELLIDPKDTNRVHPRTASVDKKLWGRLKVSAPLPRRGRLAAGTPFILDERAPLLAVIPADAPVRTARHVPRADVLEQLKARVMATGGTITTAIGVKGMGGVGSAWAAVNSYSPLPCRKSSPLTCATRPAVSQRLWRLRS